MEKKVSDKERKKVTEKQRDGQTEVKIWGVREGWRGKRVWERSQQGTMANRQMMD